VKYDKMMCLLLRGFHLVDVDSGGGIPPSERIYDIYRIVILAIADVETDIDSPTLVEFTMSSNDSWSQEVIVSASLASRHVDDAVDGDGSAFFSVERNEPAFATYITVFNSHVGRHLNVEIC